jgi:uncharacterized membrane protein
MSEQQEAPPAAPPPPEVPTGPSIRKVIPRPGLWARLRAYLITGLLVTTPALFTLYVGWVAINFVDHRAARLIPPEYNPNTYLPFSIPGVGVLVLLVLLTLIGMLTTGYLGRTITRATDRALARVPFMRFVYATTKQILESVLSASSTTFRQVALVEYPRREMWSVAFVTGTVKVLVHGQEEEMVSLFIPFTPNPTSGMLRIFPRRDVTLLDMPVEDGVKLVMSGGIISPEWLKAQVAHARSAEVATVVADPDSPPPKRTRRASVGR